MSRALLGTILFTLLEVVTLVGWLILAQDGENLLSLGVLTFGLFAEHYVSVNVGNGRKPFGPLPPD